MRILLFYLFSILYIYSLSLSFIDAGKIIFYTSDCKTIRSSLPFEGSDVCTNNWSIKSKLPSFSLKLTCYRNNNSTTLINENNNNNNNTTTNKNNDNYLWPQQPIVIVTMYTDSICSPSAAKHQIDIIHPDACIRGMTVICDDYTDDRPADILNNWYDRDILLSSRNSESPKVCPSSGLLFNHLNPQYVRSIGPLNTCLPAPKSNKNYQAVKITCTLDENSVNGTIITQYYYDDPQCNNTPIDKQVVASGCLKEHDDGRMARTQCRVGSVWSNDNF